MKLVVGLGNPGLKYEKNRHNIGFIVLDELNLEFKKEIKFDGLVAKKGSIIYLKPQTYMNLSGSSVRKVVDYYQIAIEDIYVIHDDIDLEFGKIRFKRNSSHGGQNGVRDMIDKLKTQEFNRIKIGIGRDPFISVANYVLGNFSESQISQLPKVLKDVKEKLKEYSLIWITKT